MKKFWHWSKSHWQLLAVTLFGAILRFYRLRELTTFGGDQGVDYQFVAQMIVSGHPRLLGPITHVGVFLGPLYYYLLVPFFIIFHFDPIAAPFFFALVGSLTVGLVFILAKKFLSVNFAFLTSLLYASSPVIIESSRAPSQPDLIPFFAALFLISTIRIIQKQATKWDGLLIGVALGATIQFHFLAFPLWIFTIIVLSLRYSNYLNNWSTFKWFWCNLSAALILLLSPWVAFEVRHQFFISRQIILFLGTGEIGANPLGVFPRFLDLTWFSVGRLIAVDSQFLTVGILIAIIAGAVLSHKNKNYVLFFMYTTLNLIGIALYINPLSNHYIAAIYPSVVLLTGIGIFFIFSKRVSMALFVLLILTNLKHYNPFRDYGYTMPNGVNTKTIQKASKIIADDWKTHGRKTFNVANTLDGDTRAQPYRYTLTFVEGAKPADVEHYADNDFLYIVTDLSVPQLLTDNRWEIMSFPVTNVEKIGAAGKRTLVYRMTRGSADRNEVLMQYTGGESL